MPRLLVSSCFGLVLAASLVGCGSRSVKPSTDLTLVALNPWVGRAVFHLSCAPAGGDLGDPARACAAVPIDYGTSSTGYGGKNVTSVTLSVTHNRDGSVSASCHVGDA